ncbi:MAG: ROK family protein [Bacillota bacterium]
MKYYIGIDLGGTNIKAGIVSENGEVLLSKSIKTNCPRSSESIMDDMAQLCSDVACEFGITLDKIEKIGIGTPGTVNNVKGELIYSNNLDAHNVMMKDYLEKKLQRKVFVDNDANAAAVAEYIFGAGRDVKDMIAITLGTGVGSGIIVDGKILQGSMFSGGEIGHMVISVGGRDCTCGRKGCFEAYSSATGLIATTKEKMLANKQSAMWNEVSSIDQVNGRLAYDYSRKGDETAMQVVQEYQEYLASGLASVINIFQPDVICLGGGVANEKENLLIPVREIVERETYDKDNHTKIVSAELGYQAGIVGAAFLWKIIS